MLTTSFLSVFSLPNPLILYENANYLPLASFCGMNESVANVPCFQQSVSFGRFEHDSLCWEKWSTFPTNKYLEEVEKCSTPGSVAQKKAYFEAHYRKIAARKAELLQEQERKEEAELANFCNNSEEVLDYVKCDVQNSVKFEQLKNNVADFSSGVSVVHADVKSGGVDVFNQENEVADLDIPSEMSEHTDGAHTVDDLCEVGDISGEKLEHVDESNNGVNITDEVIEEVKVEVTEHIGELNDDADVIDEVVKHEVTKHIDESKNGNDFTRASSMQLKEEDATEVLCPSTEIPMVKKSIGPVYVTQNMSSLQGFQTDVSGLSAQEKIKGTIAEEKPVILNIPKEMEKAALVKKTIDAPKAKKNLASSIPRRSTITMPKSPILPTPKSSKPELTNTARSTHRSLNKNENDSTPLTNKKRTGHESKRVVPTSLHMSINLQPAKTDPASGTTRKPLIMERMGDKDIVRRAFKAFQNVTQVPQSNLAKSPATNQSASGYCEQKGSPANTLKKKNEGIRRAAKTDSTLIGQQGTRKTLLSPGRLTKNVGAERRHVKSFAASFCPAVQLRGNTKKAASRKLEVSSKPKVSEAMHLQPKVKVEKTATMKKPSQLSTSRTKLSLSYN